MRTGFLRQPRFSKRPAARFPSQNSPFQMPSLHSVPLTLNLPSRWFLHTRVCRWFQQRLTLTAVTLKTAALRSVSTKARDDAFVGNTKNKTACVSRRVSVGVCSGGKNDVHTSLFRFPNISRRAFLRTFQRHYERMCMCVTMMRNGKNTKVFLDVCCFSFVLVFVGKSRRLQLSRGTKQTVCYIYIQLKAAFVSNTIHLFLPTFPPLQ